jgi:putative ABC transport system substrate-binding protein
MSNQRNSRWKHPKVWAALSWAIVIALLLSGCAQQPKVYRVGILSGLEYFANTVDGLKAGMAELGYKEGQNIIYDVQKTNFDPAAEDKILKKFVADQVDLIFVFPTEASLEAKAATQGTNIPVLFANANIEGVELVKSVREPGGNITGVRFPGPDLVLKRFEIMRELVPQAKRMLVAYQRGYPIVASEMDALRPAAQAAGVTLVEIPADTPAELQAELDKRAAAADIGFDAILLIPEPLVGVPAGFAVVAKLAYERKLPIGGTYIASGDYVSIFGVAPDNVAVGKQAAPLADKFLKGTPAGTIPVASAEGNLVINLKAAQAFGLTVSDGLLRQAVEVIR